MSQKTIKCPQIGKKNKENLFRRIYNFLDLNFSLKSIQKPKNWPYFAPRGDILTLSAQISTHWLIPKYLLLYYFAYLLKYLLKPS